MLLTEMRPLRCYALRHLDELRDASQQVDLLG